MSMEKKTSAQENFYLFMNEEWINDPKNKIPDEYNNWNNFMIIVDKVFHDLIGLVKGLFDKENCTEEEKKICAIWNASYDRFDNWDNNMANYDPILSELTIFDSFLKPELQLKNTEDLLKRFTRYLHYTHKYGIGNLFSFDKETDFDNSQNVILDFSATGMSLPSRKYYLDDAFAKQLSLYREHLENIEKLIPTLPGSFVDDVIWFETELAKIFMEPEQKREFDKYYTNTTLSGLYEEINNLKSLPSKQNNFPENDKNILFSEEEKQYAKFFFEKCYDKFNFRKILENNYNKNFSGKNISNPPKIDQITVYDGDAIRRVLRMLFKHENFQKYLSFQKYKIICSLKDFCTEEISDEFFDFYGRKLNGQKEQKTRDKRTIGIINACAGEMLGRVYSEHFFPEKYKEKILEMVNGMIQVMKNSVKNSNWLTDSTKEKALLKLSKIRIKIGFPNKWKDYSDIDIQIGDNLYEICRKVYDWNYCNEFINKINSIVDKEEWGMSPQTVNAYNDLVKNEVAFTAAFLQPPFHCKTENEIDNNLDLQLERDAIKKLTGNDNYDFARSVNYGTIGAIIAHEITHSLDDQGRKFDEDGIIKDWWNEEDSEKFNYHSRLMGKQAANYVYTDPDGNSHRLNPELTMGENLADVGGLIIAMRALTSELEQKGVSEKEIEINQRVFFKANVNVWKSNANNDFLIKLIATDPHPPPEFRANLIKNLDEFYKLFNVTENDSMFLHPNERVMMW
jgi:putative endopeptidase